MIGGPSGLQAFMGSSWGHHILSSFLFVLVQVSLSDCHFTCVFILQAIFSLFLVLHWGRIIKLGIQIAEDYFKHKSI